MGCGYKNKLDFVNHFLLFPPPSIPPPPNTHNTHTHTHTHTHTQRASTIQDLSWENARAVLVGNKCDLTDSRVVTPDQCRELAQSLGFEFFETSAKDDINVKQTFEHLVDAISEKMAESIEKNPNFLPRGTRPRTLDSNPQASSSCAC